MEMLDIQQELDALFDFNPPFLRWQDSYDFDSPSSDPVLPLSFYDRNLGESSVLKRVRSMPSLLDSIAGTVDKALKSIKDRGIELPPISDLFVTQEDREFVFRDDPIMFRPQSVAEVYRQTIAKCCKTVASMLLIHPSADSWLSCLEWEMWPFPLPGGQSYALEDRALRVSHHFSSDAEPYDFGEHNLDDETINLLREVRSQFMDLATWEILPMTAEALGLLESMSDLSNADYFEFEACRVITDATRNLPIRPQTMDAIETPWVIPTRSPEKITKGFVTGEESVDRPSRNTRSRTTLRPRILKGKSRETKPNLDSVSVLPRTRKGKPKEQPLSRVTVQRLVQHAWAESTRKDTTLIIFHAGNLERIAIRHRETQTLYISDLIHVDTCKNPAYGKLHVGLYITALSDAINRVKIIGTDETKSVRGSVKRSLDDATPASRVKRRRMATTSAHRMASSLIKPQGIQDVFKDIRACKLAIVYLDYGVHTSRIPASLFRLQPSIPPQRSTNIPTPRKLKRTYKPHEYITLIVGLNFSYGGTGIVHEARLEARTKQGNLTVHDVVVKLAFTPSQRQRLWYEYSIYHLLSSNRVSGILTAIGVYGSAEDGVSALVMTRGGTSIHYRHGGVAALTPSQKAAFLKSLKEMHRVGVCHGDIRLPNLLVDDAGQVAIIDFDRSKIDPSANKTHLEYEKLSRMLDGFDVETPFSP